MAVPISGQKNLRRGRWSIEGAYYFITFNTLDRRAILANPEVADILLGSLRFLGNQGAMEPFCGIVMPDHVHIVFELRQSSLSGLMNRFKGYTGWKIGKELGLAGAVWDRQYYEHRIRNDESFLKIIDYCRANPVRRGLVEDRKDWPYWWCDWDVDGHLG